MTSLFSAPIMPGFGFARARDKAFAAIRELWRVRQSEGVTQADLADRLKRDPAWVCRKLSGPSNWTLRTFGDLADALDGEVEISITDLRAWQALGNSDAYSDHEDRAARERAKAQSGEATDSNRLPLAT